MVLYAHWLCTRSIHWGEMLTGSEGSTKVTILRTRPGCLASGVFLSRVLWKHPIHLRSGGLDKKILQWQIAQKFSSLFLNHPDVILSLSLSLLTDTHSLCVCVCEQREREKQTDNKSERQAYTEWVRGQTRKVMMMVSGLEWWGDEGKAWQMCLWNRKH